MQTIPNRVSLDSFTFTATSRNIAHVRLTSHLSQRRHPVVKYSVVKKWFAVIDIRYRYIILCRYFNRISKLIKLASSDSDTKNVLLENIMLAN